MSISFVTVFQPLISAITPHLVDAAYVLLSIVALICLVGLSDNLSGLILKLVRGPDHRAGWSESKKLAYSKYKDRYDFKKEFERESRQEIRRRARRF